MNARDMFNKALLLLDRGRTTDGENQLREALLKAEQEEDTYDRVQILYCLACLMKDLGRLVEAIEMFQRVIPLAETEGLDKEADDARAGLKELHSSR